MKPQDEGRKPRFQAVLLGLAWSLGLVVVGLPVAVAQSGAAPLVLSFDKADPDGDATWRGQVSGDISGNLTTIAREIDDSNPIWQVVFDFIIDAGAESMTIRLTGTLNSNTGQVVMQGEVTEGYLRGAVVQEEGQLVDPKTSQFQGSIRILPEIDDPSSVAGTGGERVTE